MRTADMRTPGRARMGCRLGLSPRRLLKKHCHTRMTNLLLVAALLPIGMSDGAPVQNLYLRCSGEYSSLTHDDCHGIYHDNTAACYYNSISSQYWPCAKFCNNKLFPSREAQQCQSKCPEYYQNSCQHLPVTTSSVPLPTTLPRRITTTPKPVLEDWIIIVIVALAVVATVLFILLLIKRCCMKKPDTKRIDSIGTQDSNLPDLEQSNQGGMAAEYQFYCRDPEASYTFNNCSSPAGGDALVNKGCYFDDGKSQYRPCGDICNDVTSGSLGEERCKDTVGCQNYLSDYCDFDAVTTPQIQTTTTTKSSDLDSWEIALIVIVPLCVMVAVILIIFFLRRKKKRDRRGQNNGGQGQQGQELDNLIRPQQASHDDHPPPIEYNDPNYHPQYTDPLNNAEEPGEQDPNRPESGLPLGQNGDMSLGAAAGDNGGVAQEQGTGTGCNSNPAENGGARNIEQL